MGGGHRSRLKPGPMGSLEPGSNCSDCRPLVFVRQRLDLCARARQVALVPSAARATGQSIGDVEGVAECAVQVGADHLAEASDRFRVEVGERDCENVVAVDDAGF